MPLRWSWRGTTLVWMVAQACATYDGLPIGPSAGGAGGMLAGGGTQGGSGDSGSAGESRGGAAGSGASSGQANTGGKGGAVSAAGNSNNAGDGALGGAEAGGAPPSSMAGAGGVPGSAGEGGTAGGGPECTSKAPELTCNCSVFGAHEYWFCATYLTFTAAENKCKAVGMHLPKIETQAEETWVFDTATNAALGEYFLGATDATTPNEWSWVAGGKLWSGVANGTAYGYTNWSPNEPNGSGDCLVEQANAVWDDRTCTDQRRYICESL